MTCSIDWVLILEYVKALAAPIATVGAVVLVARLAVNTFRDQKAIERRLTWYEGMHHLLGETADAFAIATHPSSSVDVDRARTRIARVNEIATKLGLLSGDAWLYADQEGLDAVQRLTAVMTETLSAGAITPDRSSRIVKLCLVTAASLSHGMRKHLGLKALRGRDTPLPMPPDAT
jgi:hypothetical protein